MSNTIRGIFIDSVGKQVYEVRVPHESRESDWRYTRDRLDCQWIERVHYKDGQSLWVDEEGFLVQPNPRGYFSLFLPQLGRVGVFAGHGLILGTTTSGFDTGTTLNVEEVRANVRFLGMEDLGPEQLDPKITVTTTAPDGTEEVLEFRPEVRKG